MNQTIKRIALELQMINAVRWVEIRGYKRKVIVSHRSKSTGEWIVKPVGAHGNESVPEHMFYHIDGNGFLVLRGSVEFQKKYPTHEVHIEKLPSPNHY